MFKTMVVESGKISKQVELEQGTQLDQLLGIDITRENWEVMSTNIEGVAIVAHDQDKKNLQRNRMNIRGTFAFVGLKEGHTIENPRFVSLTEEQMSTITWSMAKAVFKGAGFSAR